jgi:hypothetical protein
VILPRSPQMCQNGSLSVLSSIRETQRKVAGCQVRGVGLVGDDSHVVSCKKFPDKKGSVRRHVVVQRPVPLSPNFKTKSLHIFRQLL